MGQQIKTDVLYWVLVQPKDLRKQRYHLKEGNLSKSTNKIARRLKIIHTSSMVRGVV
jgi:hypothetical protein